MAQSFDDIYGDAHVCGGKDVVQHQRTFYGISQIAVVFFHLFRRQCVVGRQGGNDNVGTGSGIGIGLLDLFAHTVSCQSGIDKNASLSRFHGGLDEQQSVSL